MPRRKDGHIRQQISTTNAIGVISDIIAKDLNYNQIAEKWGVNHQTVHNISNAFTSQIENTKTEIVENVLARLPEKLGTLTSSLMRIGQQAVDCIDEEKLKKSSAVQLITVAGIAIDKMQLLSGGATAIVQHQHFKKSDMLSKLNENIIDVSPESVHLSSGNTQKHGENGNLSPETSQKEHLGDSKVCKKSNKSLKSTVKSVSKDIKAIKSELAKVLDNGIVDKTANGIGEKYENKRV